MNTIFGIFQNDLRGLKKNFLALVIAVGLCILPSLYAWFNIYSNWDPYANTQNVPIAVASDDVGFEKSDGTYVNMGDEVLDQLRENEKLGWTFTATTKDAIDGVYSGEYYAALILGEDFSESMYHCLANDMEHPKIYYYENEKKNAIAVKITDSGSTSLQSSINTEFLNVVITTLSENIDELSDGEGGLVEELETKVRKVNDNLISYGELVDSFVDCNTSLSDTILDLKDILPRLNNVLYSGTNAVNNIQSSVNTAAALTNTAIGTKLNAMAVKATVINNAVNVAQTALAQKDDPSIVAENLKIASDNLSSISSDAAAVSNELESLKGSGSESDAEIESIQSRLANVSERASRAQSAASRAAVTTDKIHDVAEVIQDANRKIVSAAIDEAVAELPKLNEEIYSDLSSKVNEVAGNVNSSVQSAAGALQTGAADTETMGTVFDGVSQSLLAGNAALTNSKGMIDSTTEKLTRLLEELDSVDEGEKYQKLLEILQNDPSLYGEFLSQPVSVVTEPVYETSTYGSAVTPFYTTLALWVGAIILVSLLKVKVEPKGEFQNASPSELFWGRYLLFWLLGQVQAVICVYGNLQFLEVQCHEEGLFYLAASLTSFTFTLLIYTLTISFGDIGKAFAVVIMVIQIAGSSGTYPIELLPDIFQAIYKYFPFPYAINAMRETISGMYEDDFWVYLGELLLFALASVIVGLVIRKPFMKINHFLEKRMEDTEMM